MSNLFDMPTVSPQQGGEEVQQQPQPQAQGNLFDMPTQQSTQGDPRQNLAHNAEAQEKFGTPKPGTIADILKDVPRLPPQESSGNAFLDGVESFNRGFGRKAEGVMQMASKLFGMSNLEKKVGQLRTQQEASLKQAEQRSPTATSIGGVAGQIASDVAYGGAAALPKKLAGKVLAGTLTAAGLSGLEYANSEEERANKMALAGGLGGLVSGILGAAPVVKAISKRIKSGFTSEEGVSTFRKKVFDPQGAAAEDIAYNVETAVAGKAGKLNKSIKTATDVGAEVTPGQAAGGDILRSAEKALTPTTKQTRTIQQFVDKQDTNAFNQMKKVISDMTPGGYVKAKAGASKLYNKMKNTTVDDEAVAAVQKNPVLSGLLKKISKTDASELKNLPDNSLFKLDGVKRRIDTALRTSAQAAQGAKPLADDVVSGYKQAREQLMKVLKPYENYTKARDTALRVIARSKYIKNFKAKDTKAGQRGVHSVEDVYDTILSGTKKDDLMADVIKTGGDATHAKKVVDLFDQLRNSPIKDTLRKIESKTGEIIAKGRPEGILQDMVNKFGTKSYHDALLELTLSGQSKWTKAINEVYKHKDNISRMTKFMDVIKSTIKTVGKTTAGKVAPRSLSVIGGRKAEEDQKQGYLK